MNAIKKLSKTGLMLILVSFVLWASFLQEGMPINDVVVIPLLFGSVITLFSALLHLRKHRGFH